MEKMQKRIGKVNDSAALRGRDSFFEADKGKEL